MCINGKDKGTDDFSSQNKVARIKAAAIPTGFVQVLEIKKSLG